MGGPFRESRQGMITRSGLKRLRWLTILQVVLLLPTTVMGSICVPAKGIPTFELGICACMALPAGPGTPTLAWEGSSDCGPCKDVAISAVRSSRSASLGGPPVATQLFAHAERTDHLCATASPGAQSSGQPPGNYSSILRC